MLEHANSLDAGMHIAQRFGQLRDLPEHGLYPQIHARLATGESAYSVAKWVQAVVPVEDPYSKDIIAFDTLRRRLQRYSALLPVTSKIPKSYIDNLTHGIELQINVIAELASAIHYQKARIGLFAETEKTFPMGVPSEQQRKEVAQLTDMLREMRVAQISLGAVPGYLAPQLTLNSSTTNINIGNEDRLGADPFTRFLLNNPQAIPHIMAGLDRVFAESEIIDGEASEVEA